ncbi:MAG: hypothetical protein SCH72_11830, partial [Desulfuromonadales bacterium]|nr:hypothetical protein [Desulfuromonadales bacterium]
MIGVAVSLMHDPAVPVRYALDRSGGRRDIESAAGSNGDTAQVQTGSFAGGNDGFNLVTCAKPLHEASTLGAGAGDAEAIHTAHLTAAP